MKKISLIVLVALFVLTPVSIYAYSRNNEETFDWMPHFFTNDGLNHHQQMEEWFEEERLNEETNGYRDYHDQMYDYGKTRGFGCHN